jgi:tetratricopeptide (TPR) repeat protein
MNRLLFLLLGCLFLLSSRAYADPSYDTLLNKGIRNSDAYSYMLMQEARGTESERDQLLQKALRYSPDSPAVYFELSKARFSFTPIHMFETVDYILQGIFSYKRNFWWRFSFATALFMSVVISFVISMTVLVAMRIPQDTSLFAHDIKEEKTKLLTLLVLIFSVFGPFYLVGSLLILVSFYIRKWDRAVVYFYLFFLFMLPWIFEAFSISLTAPSSASLKAVVQVNESRGNMYALSVLKNERDPVARFSYALALKREGRYREAKDLYEELAQTDPDARVYNNLANCYVAMNNFDKAMRFYKASIQEQPMASALYNLSQVQRRSLLFTTGDESFLAAQQLDPDAVWEYRQIYSRNPNRFVIDEGLPMAKLWGYALKKTRFTAHTGALYMPALTIFVITLMMGIVFYILDWYFKSKAYRCKRCGTILCSKCEKHLIWGQMCLQCYRSLVKLDESDSKERIARILTVYEYRKKRRSILRLLAYLVPGSAQIYAGDILYGLVFLWPFLFLLLFPVMNSLFSTEMSEFSQFWINIISLFLLFLLYFFSNVITRRRLGKGWL